jgi:hypothetical protein
VWVGYLEKEFFWGFKTYMKSGPHTTHLHPLLQRVVDVHHALISPTDAKLSKHRKVSAY